MAGTKRTFNDMLNQYLAYELLKAEQQKRNFVMSRVETDESWRGGDLIVPFQGGSASSFKYGGLTAVGNVSENRYVRGVVSGYKEIWGTMMFHSRDLMEHGGGGGAGEVSEQSFLKNLPDTITQFMDDLKQVVSVNFLNGTHIATLTATTTSAVGIFFVDHPERVTLQQYLTLKDADSTISGYVSAIDMNTGSVTVSTTRADSLLAVPISPVSFAAANTQTAPFSKVYVDGADTVGNAFTPIRDQVLSVANGGSAQLFGQTKTAFPYLQSTNVNGSGLTSATFLDGLFDFVNFHRTLGRMGADELVMSYKKLGTVMKLLELKAGAYRHVKSEANLYGWTTITIVGVKGEFKITGVQEMDNDVVYLADWKGLKVHTNQGFKKQADPEGKVYTTVRAADGFEYYVDLCFYGELILNRPSTWGVLHSIPTTF